MTKRIIVQDYAGHPFQVQLSRKLAERGHHVLHLYAGHNQTPRGSLQRLECDAPSFAVEGLYIRKPLRKNSFIRRLFQECEYGRLVVEAVARFKPDVVVSANMPLDPQASLQKYCAKNDLRFIFWLQDVVSLATRIILAQKIPLLGRLIGNYYATLEQQVLANSDHIVMITAGYEPFLRAAGVSPTKTTLISNWAPLDEIPALPKDNPWARAHGLADKFCFLYSGTLGLKHKPDLLLQLALHFKDDPQVVVYVGSEGPGAEWLTQKKQELDLPNLWITGYQPMSVFPQVLAAGDVLVAILEPDAGEYSVPSKVLSYLAAQRPLLLIMPPKNLASRIVKENRAGFVVDPANSAEMFEKARELYSNPELRQTFARNARCYAEQHFDIEKIADHFEALL